MILPSRRPKLHLTGKTILPGKITAPELRARRVERANGACRCGPRRALGRWRHSGRLRLLPSGSQKKEKPP
jgi:hypothetical protein